MDSMSRVWVGSALIQRLNSQTCINTVRHAQARRACHIYNHAYDVESD
jgi:hypothetical protein